MTAHHPHTHTHTYVYCHHHHTETQNIWKHTHTHAHTHTHTHTHSLSLTYTYIYITIKPIHTHTHRHTFMHTHTHTPHHQTNTNTHRHTCMCADTPTHTHKRQAYEQHQSSTRSNPPTHLTASPGLPHPPPLFSLPLPLIPTPLQTLGLHCSSNTFASINPLTASGVEWQRLATSSTVLLNRREDCRERCGNGVAMATLGRKGCNGWKQCRKEA